MKAKMNHGDFRTMVTGDLYRKMEQIIHQKSGRRRPYYIMVLVRPYYQGAASVARMEGGRPVAPQTVQKVVGGNVCHARLILMERPPAVPQLGTILWKIDNVRGRVKLCYSLPFDKPNLTEDSDSAGQVAKIAAESAQNLGVPLFFN